MLILIFVQLFPMDWSANTFKWSKDKCQSFDQVMSMKTFSWEWLYFPFCRNSTILDSKMVCWKVQSLHFSIWMAALLLKLCQWQTSNFWQCASLTINLNHATALSCTPDVLRFICTTHDQIQTQGVTSRGIHSDHFRCRWLFAVRFTK